MQHYELVLMLNANTSEADRKAFLADLEAKFTVKEKDEIGIQTLSFKLKDKNTKAYFVSYLLELAPEQVKDVKAALLYNQAVVRYEIYKMTAEQKFFHFEKLQSEFDKAIEDIKDKRFGQKITFFADERNAKYINWKSIPILKYYLTRFGDIKPRLYTGNSVKIQKKLRQEIIRARTLGLLNFISR
ncbi:MAG: 30S ribosomal protein S18 [candidate division SR1 bacterium]|nr:30S ribosomal protein S18 [candidate division SR1 bacterium]MBB1578822.1 30S ribosomal protein S18 [candidate division SR1 bacterium]MBF0932002.1 30S ribosomal protein S18 [candidate division SR1 bacterium]